MSKNLVIVESPAKAKTIEKFLGKDFKVSSCFGHIVDLPSKELGVNIDNDFKPKYIVNDDKKKIVNELKKLVKDVDIVWIASDEDREGEAIAWHMFKTLDLNNQNTKRIVFHEITKKAILSAIENPREINLNLVNAQQARRVLDRLVGYELSPVLWKKVKGGLSAGRVQSVSVRLIVEREREITNFKPSFFYKTSAFFKTQNGQKFRAVLDKEFYDEKNVESFLESNKNNIYKVFEKKVNPGKKSPTPPFTTSTLQQEASRKLSFPVGKTMGTAQKLYEAGFITYMRTDSVSLSNEAIHDIKYQIEKAFGKQYFQKRFYKSKNKSAQEAHEAVRPTDFSKKIIDNIDYDQKRLYELIWKRTIASQMSDSIIEKTFLKIKCNKNNLFNSSGEVTVFDGFIKVYKEGIDNSVENDQGTIPDVNVDELINLEELISTQKYTRPPFRFSEATLVKKLEELGIGRPSTYAPTISTVQNRGYIVKGTSEGIERTFKQIFLKENNISHNNLIEKYGGDKGKLTPSDTGYIVNDFLVNNFKSILDYNFTAKVEENFDKIAEGFENWTGMIKEFYKDFSENVNHVSENANRESGERILGVDPQSGREVKVRLGKFGPLAQIGNINDESKPIFSSLTPNQRLDNVTLDEVLDLFKLPKSIGVYENEDLIVNNGRYGPYIKFGKKYVSIPKTINPLEVDFEEAKKLIDVKLKSEAPIHIYKNLPVTKGVGRFGPFLKWDNGFYNVGKNYNFNNLDENDIEIIIEDKIKKDKEKIINDWTEDGIRIEKGRWGKCFIIKGKLKIQIAKEKDPSKLSLNEVKDIIQFNSKKKIKSKS